MCPQGLQPVSDVGLLVLLECFQIAHAVRLALSNLIPGRLASLLHRCQQRSLPVSRRDCSGDQHLQSRNQH